MEKELKQNKWYKLTSGKLILIKPWYVKFNIIQGQIIKCTDYINDDFKFKSTYDSNFGSIGEYIFTSIDLSEIQEYLPDGHPDKVLPETLLTNIL
jgi:hypothetical protein